MDPWNNCSRTSSPSSARNTTESLGLIPLHKFLNLFNVEKENQRYKLYKLGYVAHGEYYMIVSGLDFLQLHDLKLQDCHSDYKLTPIFLIGHLILLQVHNMVVQLDEKLCQLSVHPVQCNGLLSPSCLASCRVDEFAWSFLQPRRGKRKLMIHQQ